MGEEGGGFHTSTTLNASRAKDEDEKTREKTQKQQEKAKKCCFLIGCWFYAPGLNVSHSNIDRINYYVKKISNWFTKTEIAKKLWFFFKSFHLVIGEVHTVLMAYVMSMEGFSFITTLSGHL